MKTEFYRNLRGRVNRMFASVGISLVPGLPKGVFKFSADRLYCKTQAAFDKLMVQLKASGFSIERTGNDHQYAKRGEYYDRSRDCRNRMHQSFSIYEAWKWGLPLKPSVNLAEKILNAGGETVDFGYYIGSDLEFKPIYTREKLVYMRKFVEHFTALDLAAWDNQIAWALRTPAGMVRFVVTFCCPDAKVNASGGAIHALMAIHNVANGIPVSRDLANLAESGLPELVRLTHRSAHRGS